MLEKDEKGYYIEGLFNETERKLFINFLLHERERHLKDVDKIDKDIRELEIIDEFGHVPTN